jgi:hypothetical protein
MRSPCCLVCLCIPPSTLEYITIVYETYYIYIMAPDQISTAYFMNPSHQSVCLYSPIIAGQRLGKHVPAATNTRNNRTVGRIVSYGGLCRIK